MGGGGSQSIKNTLNIKSTTKMLTKTVTETKTSASAACDQAQKLKVKLKNVVGCDMDVNQVAACDVTASAAVSVSTLSAAKNKVMEDMKAKTKAALDKSTQAGNFQFGDRSNVDTEVNKELETIIQDEFEEKNLTEIVATSSQVQDGELEVDGYDCTMGGQIKWNQNMAAQVAATAVMDKITKRITESDVTKKVKAEIDSKSKSEAGGAAQVVDSVGGAVSSVIGAAGMAAYAPIIACVCCVMILAIVGMVMGKSPAGQNAIRRAPPMKMPPMKLPMK